jgi:hypothetical protein
MITDNEFHYWATEEEHSDNNETMSDFLNNELTDDYSVILVDGTYAEIQDESGHRWEVHASGDGDFYNHKVQFVPLGF